MNLIIDNYTKANANISMLREHTNRANDRAGSNGNFERPGDIERPLEVPEGGLTNLSNDFDRPSEAERVRSAISSVSGWG